MKCCFIGHRDNFGNKKDYKAIENAIRKLVDCGVDEFYSRAGNCFEYMCEDGVKKTDAKLIYVHYDIKSTGLIMKHYYDFVIIFNGTGDAATQMFYRDRYVVDICDICLYLPCNNAEELNLLGYAKRNNKKIFVIE